METSLNIVLLEPQIPQNTGNIARTCAAIGASLHLIAPLGFKIDEKAVRRAGLDYWNMLTLYEYNDVNDFFLKNEKDAQNIFFITTKAGNTYTDITFPKKTFLVFGREDAGIDEYILKDNIEKCLRIPMVDDSRSLNLSNAVAIVAYEVLRQDSFIGLTTFGKFKD